MSESARKNESQPAGLRLADNPRLWATKSELNDLFSQVEQARISASESINPRTKSRLGQFFTPPAISRFMAGMFSQDTTAIARLLDPGAGVGALSVAFVERWALGGFGFQRIEVDAFEIDDSLIAYLTRTFKECEKRLSIFTTIRCTDFIKAATEWLSSNLFATGLRKYTHAILNPPYKKIRSDSQHRSALRKVGIETVNLYSAFVGLSLSLLEEDGELVAIIPRSFCNGLYYRPFREFILKHAALKHIHLFGSRSKAFKHDDVLQENIIIRLVRARQEGPVTVSTSTDDTFDDLVTHEYSFDQIVFQNDSEKYIHVPTSPDKNSTELSSAICHSLAELGIKASTGPVVDFRLKNHLREMPEPGTVPLLYPKHCSGSRAKWPVVGMKKPNYIQRNTETEKWLYPNGYYCVVRRFSSKEEKHRIVASVVDPTLFKGVAVLGFENHLNLFHEDKHGLPEALAYGLAVFLNSTAVDEAFRRFNGHTQVNATDLKQMKYPSRNALIDLGKWAIRKGELTQTMIDQKLGSLG